MLSIPSFEFPPVSGTLTSVKITGLTSVLRMLCYFEKVMFPYLSKKRDELNLSSDYPALLTFDHFKGQCTHDLLQLLDSNNINVIIVPANCTDRL